MRFFKFIVKHGPGSMGHNAKVLARMFTVLKKEHPSYLKNELFKEVLNWRMSKPYKMFVGKQPSEDEMDEMIWNADGKLSRLILELSHWERSKGFSQLSDLAWDDTDRYMDVVEAIQEIVQKYAPDGDWPETIEQAVSWIISEMSNEDKLMLRNVKGENLVNYHFSLGMRVRNSFGLWAGNKKLLKLCGSETMHPDDASTVITKAVRSKLQSFK